MAVVTPEAPILPWPRILRQSWLNLSFLHWAVKPASIAHLYPPDTEPDTFEGSSFVGVVPFQMADTGFARGPAFFGTFLETNVRLYSVDRTGRRGVLFLSLGTNRLDMVAAGRVDLRRALSVGPNGYREQGDRCAYTSTLRWRGSQCIELRRGGGGRSADVRTARAVSDRTVGLTRRSRVRRARRSRQAGAGSRDVQRRCGGTIRPSGAVDEATRGQAANALITASALVRSV
jgi:uncharacterized protein YqjF (DUF2071 family)